MRLRPFVLPLTLLLVPVLASAPRAAAQVDPLATLRTYEHVDLDGSGDISCGDELRYALHLGSADNAGDLEDVQVVLDIPDSAVVIPGSVVATNPHDTAVVTHGNEEHFTLTIEADFGFVCSTAGACNGLSLGAELSFNLRILQPNTSTAVIVGGEMTGSNFPPEPTDDPTTSAPHDDTTVFFTPCPPPIVSATLGDQLVDDLDLDGLVDPGDTVRYHVSVANTGGADAASLRFLTSIPDHTTLTPGSVVAPPGSTVTALPTTLTVDLPALAAGSTLDLTFDVRVDPGLSHTVTQIACQGRVSATSAEAVDTDDPDTLPAPDPTVTPLDHDPDLALLKSAREASVAANELAVWDLTWSNAGGAAAPTAELVETVPAHATFYAAASSPGWSCPDGAPAGAACTLTLGTVPAGASGTATFAVRIDPTLPAAVSSTTNRASVRDDGSAGPDRNPANNDAEATIALDAAPDLHVVKTGPAAAAPGPVLYELTYGNTGTQDATAVELVEQVPAHATFDATASPGWSCPDGAPAGTACVHTVGGLAAGEVGHTIFAVRLLPSAPHDEDLVNTAAITDDGDNGNDLDPSDNLDTAVTDVLGPPDLHVAKTGPSEVAAGSLVAYDLAYGNRGEQLATGVVLRETVPAPATFDAAGSSPGWSCTEGAPAGTACTLAIPDLPPGDTGTATFAVRLSPAAPPGDDLINRVTISDDGAHGPDADPTDNTDTAVTDVLGPPDLHVAKTGPAQAAAGTLVVFDVTHGNRGEQLASGVVLRETVPAPAVFDAAGSTPGWSCADGAPAGTACALAAPDLPPGGTGTATFAVRLPAAIPAGVEALTNHVEIDDDGSHGTDPAPADNTASATTPIEAVPDLAIDKMDGDLVAERGVPFTYTLSLANTGDQDATDVLVVDLLPMGLLVDLDGSTTGWSCAPPADDTPPACSFLLPALAAGAHQTLALRVEPLPSLPLEVTEILNVATVEDDGAGGPDPNPSDNRDEETTPLRPPTADPPDLAATLTDQVLEGAASPGVAAAGSVVSYTAVVTNQGAGDAADVAVLLPPDAHTTLRPASVTTTAGTTTVTSAGALQVDLPVLAAGDTVAVTFEVDVDDELPPMLDRLAVHGDLTAANASPTTTDDPDTPAPLDPTETPLAATDPPPAAEDIPSVSTLGLAALALLLLAAAGRRLRPVPARGRS